MIVHLFGGWRVADGGWRGVVSGWWLVAARLWIDTSSASLKGLPSLAAVERERHRRREPATSPAPRTGCGRCLAQPNPRESPATHDSRSSTHDEVLGARGFQRVKLFVEIFNLHLLLLTRLDKLLDQFFDSLLETVACVQTSNVAFDGFQAHNGIVAPLAICCKSVIGDW